MQRAWDGTAVRARLRRLPMPVFSTFIQLPRNVTTAGSWPVIHTMGDLSQPVSLISIAPPALCASVESSGT